MGGREFVLGCQSVIHRHDSAMGEMAQGAAQGVVRGQTANGKTAAMKINEHRQDFI